MARTEEKGIERHWLHPTEAADYCAVDRVTLWRARKRGDLRAGGTGRAVRFEKSELDRWMRSGPVEEQ